MSQIDALLNDWRAAIRKEYPWLTADDINVVIEEYIRLATGAVRKEGQPAVLLPCSSGFEVQVLSVGPRGHKPTTQTMRLR